jgi:dihydropteroate synthase
VNAADFAIWLATPSPRKPLIMGVLNLTPDSFSDGGKFNSIDAAVHEAMEMARLGADLIDIGGESTRPGAMPVAPPEQIRRVIPVIKAIAKQSDVLLSIDTTGAGVASEACVAGAGLINDISAGREDPQMFALAAAIGVPIILMHMLGTPQTMQQNPEYADVVQEVSRFLIERREAAIAAGIKRDQILLDPGIGFGKTDEHNLILIRETARFAALGCPLLIGASRKGFIGRITQEADPAERVFGTAAVVGWCTANGAEVLRVHDVGPMRQVVRMVQAIAERT